MRLAEVRDKRARGVVIAAPASGTGKTTVSLGLIAALAARGLDVRAAKSGPDYIDPKFLAAAAGSACINLDPWAMTPAALAGRLARHGDGAEVVVVEGVMGLFDGAEGGGGSTSDLAAALRLPVVLVVDASRHAQSIAAVVHGFATLRADRPLAGVIAARVGSRRHEGMVRAALGEVAVPYLGAMPGDGELAIASRHLGLVQAEEHAQLAALVRRAADAVAAHIDLDRLLELCQPISTAPAGAALPPLGQRIAVASDVAFGFAYPHMLDDWRRQGAEVSLFSPLGDEPPDGDCDAVFLPGGYPELHGGRLAAAARFQAGVHAAAGRGALIYGECGGYMVLGRAIVDGDGQHHAMLGLLDHVTSFAARRRHLGYRRLETQAAPVLPGRARGHEFHYSTVLDAGSDQPLFQAWDSAGRDLGLIGGRRGNVMGAYVHIISA